MHEIQEFWPGLLFVIGCVLPVIAGAADTYDAGGHVQLFVDRALVAAAENVTFTLHPAHKHPANPVFHRPSKSVIYDKEEQQFALWFQAGPNRYGYAVSRDGLKWDIVPGIEWGGAKEIVVFKDEDDPDPVRRYKLLWQRDGLGVHAGASPDGTSFVPDVSRGRDKSIWRQAGDSQTGYYDRRHRLYVAFLKRKINVRGFERRSFFMATSTDFSEWSQPKPVFVADELDDAGAFKRAEKALAILDPPIDPEFLRTEIYGAGVYQHESCVIGFPWIFTATAALGRNANGPIEIQLAVSRDLLTWDRPLREPVIDPGVPGAWDGGFMVSAAEAFRLDDEIRLYYTAYNYGHAHPLREEGPAPDYAGGLGLATWKLDRFVSADGPVDGGVLTTVPLVYAGGRIEMNARTATGGGISVELLTPAGCVLASSQSFMGDELRAEIQWQEAVDLGRWAGTPVTLRFHIRDAELYSFAFRPCRPDAGTPAVDTCPMINSLGMKFVSVPGTEVLFCVHPTRLRDWRVMAAERAAKEKVTPSQDAYHPAGFSPACYAQDGNHPVNFISWFDAQAFCEWLSDKEGRKYRLPTDHEWSCAVGIGHLEDPAAAPRDKSLKIPNVYPWGKTWPPPAGAGNFRGEECGRIDEATRRETWRLYLVSKRQKDLSAPLPRETVFLQGYDDGYPFTSPVGMYAPNGLGLYDLAGNVVEWCEDKYFPEDSDRIRVLRGGSFGKWDVSQLNSSRRYKHAAGLRYGSHGFRMVLEPKPKNNDNNSLVAG